MNTEKFYDDAEGNVVASEISNDGVKVYRGKKILFGVPKSFGELQRLCSREFLSYEMTHDVFVFIYNPHTHVKYIVEETDEAFLLIPQCSGPWWPPRYDWKNPVRLERDKWFWEI